MSIISDFDEVLTVLYKYISDSRKCDIKKHEIKFDTPDIFAKGEKSNNSENVICLQLVSKLFLLHDFVNVTDKLVSKCLVKRLLNNDYLALKEFFNESDFSILTNVVTNLSDTKFVIVLSNLAYEIVENLISPETITKAFWCLEKSPMIIITNNIFQIQPNPENMRNYSFKNLKFKNEKNFEIKLLQLLSGVTDTSRSIITTETYTFWIMKINKLMFGVLIPRYESQMKCLINVWPIVPAASFYNPTKSLNNLKIPESDKLIFHSIVSNVKQNEKLNEINLKKEILRGITLPMLIQNRININNLYMTFFLEYLHENEEFQFALPLSDSATYFKCIHCEIIFANIFEFVRHWWIIKQRLIFRCHLCSERTNRLMKLGYHYRHNHLNINDRQMNSFEDRRDNDSIVLFSKLNSKEEIKAPRKRKCPFCSFTIIGLHFMRLHLRSEHISEILKKTLLKQQTKVHSRTDHSRRRHQFHMMNIRMNPKRYFRDEFRSLFDSIVTCPLCDNLDCHLTSPITFLTHLARDHSTVCRKEITSPNLMRKKSLTRILEEKHRVQKVPCSIESAGERTIRLGEHIAGDVPLNTLPSIESSAKLVKTNNRLFQRSDSILDNESGVKGDERGIH